MAAAVGRNKLEEIGVGDDEDEEDFVVIVCFVLLPSVEIAEVLGSSVGAFSFHRPCRAAAVGRRRLEDTGVGDVLFEVEIVGPVLADPSVDTFIALSSRPFSFQRPLIAEAVGRRKFVEPEIGVEGGVFFPSTSFDDIPSSSIDFTNLLDIDAVVGENNLDCTFANILSPVFVWSLLTGGTSFANSFSRVSFDFHCL